VVCSVSPLRQPFAWLLLLPGERLLAVNAANVSVSTFRTLRVCLLAPSEATGIPQPVQNFAPGALSFHSERNSTSWVAIRLAEGDLSEPPASMAALNS